MQLVSLVKKMVGVAAAVVLLLYHSLVIRAISQDESNLCPIPSSA